MSWLHRKNKEQAVAAHDPATRWPVETESSVCTGETLIGFRNPSTGRLERAEVVRCQADRRAFYQRYGLEWPE